MDSDDEHQAPLTNSEESETEETTEMKTTNVEERDTNSEESKTEETTEIKTTCNVEKDTNSEESETEKTTEVKTTNVEEKDTNSEESETEETTRIKTTNVEKRDIKNRDEKTKVTGKSKEKGKKKTKRGVVYLSCIPQSMNVKRLREEMAKYGETGNIFLQPDEKAPFQKYKVVFTEGWVEFHDKQVAKEVAALLNNTQVGGRRKNPWWADIWNIKYLPKFQWAHLNERLAYERAVHEQRLRAEISQIKRESSFHQENFKRSKTMKSTDERKRKRGEEVAEKQTFIIRQRETEEEILARKRKHDPESEGGKTKRVRQRTKKSVHRPDCDHAVGALSLAANKSLLHKLFGGGGASQ